MTGSGCGSCGGGATRGQIFLTFRFIEQATVGAPVAGEWAVMDNTTCVRRSVTLQWLQPQP